MSYKSCSVNLQHEDVIHNPYHTTLHKLHPSLMAQCVNGEAYAVAGIYMPCLGKKTNIEWQACHVSRCLRRIETSDTLPCARVVPLPLFHILAKFSVGMCYSHA